MKGKVRGGQAGGLSRRAPVAWTKRGVVHQTLRPRLGFLLQQQRRASTHAVSCRAAIDRSSPSNRLKESTSARELKQVDSLARDVRRLRDLLLCLSVVER